VAVLSFAGYRPLILTKSERNNGMAKTRIAKLFRSGRSQAVRLPEEFRFEGDRVRVRQVPGGVLLEPLVADTAKWFEELDQWAAEPFMAGQRQQPTTPRREKVSAG
jgi:antitoxin VapB